MLLLCDETLVEKLSVHLYYSRPCKEECSPIQTSEKIRSPSFQIKLIYTTTAASVPFLWMKFRRRVGYTPSIRAEILPERFSADNNNFFQFTNSTYFISGDSDQYYSAGFEASMRELAERENIGGTKKLLVFRRFEVEEKVE